jgi:hypothetical protein
VTYVAFCDPSGGGADSFTMAIAHAANDVAVLDLVIERRPPFSPEAVVAEFSSVLKSYGLSSVSGDRYAGEWPREAFMRQGGIQYVPSQRNKSEIYGSTLPLINSRRVDLLDNQKLILQFVGLERRVGRGRDAIDHSPGASPIIAISITRQARRNRRRNAANRRITPPSPSLAFHGASGGQSLHEGCHDL